MARILLLHASVGMGHQRAAAAIARAFEQLPGVAVQVEDTLDYARPWFRRFYRGSYLSTADRIPGVWSKFYQYTDRAFAPHGMFAFSRTQYTALGMRNLCGLIERAQPDAIICTHFLPLEVLAPLQGYDLPPLACVLTDYHAHAFWAVGGADRYFVPTPAARAELIAAGIAAARVRVTGIPIDPALAQPIDRLAARRALGLPAWQPIVTLIGSGMPAARVEAIAHALLRRRLPATLVITVGRSRELARELAHLECTAGAAVRLLGPQPSLDPLIAASDLVIGKAGGLTVSEVLARGVPMFVPLPVPGQELWNVAHIERAGAGRGYADATELARDAVALLGDRQRHTVMAEAARMAGQPAAAAMVVAHILAELRQARMIARPQSPAAFIREASVSSV